MRTDKRMDQEMLSCAKIHFEQGDVDSAMIAINECIKQAKRPGTRLQAARLLIEHERDMHKHENPQKKTMVHEFPTALKIRGVEPGEIQPDMEEEEDESIMA